MSAPITTEPGRQGFENAAYPDQPPGQPPPVLQQPQGQGQAMEMPSLNQAPAGLEYLSQVDQLVVKQQVEILEAIVAWETCNKYAVMNKMGQPVYFATEDTNCIQRQCCGPKRGFTMRIADNLNHEVMKMERDFKCCAVAPCCACCGCCAHSVTVYDNTGAVLGLLRQGVSCWRPYFLVMTPDEEVVAHITGPLCICKMCKRACCGGCCCADVEFKITDSDDDKQIGMITKQWSGFVKEMFTDADTFSVSFPLELDVKVKASFFAALFLIDFMYFEQNQKKKVHK